MPSFFCLFYLQKKGGSTFHKVSPDSFFQSSDALLVNTDHLIHADVRQAVLLHIPQCAAPPERG